MTAPMGPRFTVITPVFNPPLAILEAALASVRTQTCESWEHLLIDDCSTRPGIVELLDHAAEQDPRVRVVHRTSRGGISAATNDGLAIALGEFVAFLDHDDELVPTSLEVMAAHIDRWPDADLLYSDEEKVDIHGRCSDAFIKPGWSPDRLLGQMYTGHLSVIRRTLVDEVGGFRSEFDGAQDWDLVLRATIRARRIVHVPEILYHWRTLEGSSAGSGDAKPWAHEASRRALSQHVEQLGIEAEVVDVPRYPGHYWLRPALREEPLVSVIIPTAGRTQRIGGVEVPLVLNCVTSILRRSSYENLEIIVVKDGHMGSALDDELTAAAGDRLRLVEFDEPFNFSSKVNLGVSASSGEHLLLLNDDIEVLPPAWHPEPSDSADPLPEWPTLESGALRTWIESMLVYSRQAGVGAVGAKLYFPDGKLQHAGVIASGGVVGHCFYGIGANTCGYWGNLIVPSNYLAVTAACLMTPRSAFDEVGGFDESFPVNFNDVDFCFRLHAAGLRMVLPAHVELLHRESSSRGPAPPRPQEIARLQERWGDLLEDDPFYDRRFVGGDFGIPQPPMRLSRRARDAYRHGGLPMVARRGAGWLARAGRSAPRQ